VPHGGHNMLFRDKEGAWWSTFFGNDARAPFRERPAILRIELDEQHRVRPMQVPLDPRPWWTASPPRKTSAAAMFVGAGKVELAAPAEGVGIVFTLDGNIMTTGGGDSVQTLYRQTEAIAGSPIPQGAAAELGSPDLPTANASGVGVDLSGSYRELVQRAHDLYDEGDRLFAAEEIEQGVAYFAAAAQVYEAAWKKEPGDPNVGTDWATSLFYSGDFDGAIERVRIVLEENPDFQAGWFNLGNYLTHQARMAESGDDQVETARLYGEASEAYSKAAAIDPESDTGIEAAARAAELAQ